jgi:hypothetical protein
LGLLETASDLEGDRYRGVSGELSRSLACSGSLSAALTPREQPLRRATIKRVRNARRKQARPDRLAGALAAHPSRSSDRLSRGRSLGAQCSAEPSAENGAVARATYEALRSGDLPGVGSYFADDVVWEAPDTMLTGGVIRGRDAVIEQ